MPMDEQDRRIAHDASDKHPTRLATIRTSWENSDRFERFWLTSGHRLTVVQRIGFLLFSLVAVFLGTICLAATWLQIANTSWYFIAAVLPSIAFLYIGIRGIWTAYIAPRAGG